MGTDTIEQLPYGLHVGTADEQAAERRKLVSMGYSARKWGEVANDLSRMHLEEDIVAMAETDWGKRFEIVAPLTGPAGVTVMFRSVWQIDIGKDAPRLITMYPE